MTDLHTRVVSRDTSGRPTHTASGTLLNPNNNYEPWSHHPDMHEVARQLTQLADTQTIVLAATNQQTLVVWENGPAPITMAQHVRKADSELAQHATLQRLYSLPMLVDQLLQLAAPADLNPTSGAVHIALAMCNRNLPTGPVPQRTQLLVSLMCGDRELNRLLQPHLYDRQLLAAKTSRVSQWLHQRTQDHGLHHQDLADLLAGTLTD